MSIAFMRYDIRKCHLNKSTIWNAFYESLLILNRMRAYLGTVIFSGAITLEFIDLIYNFILKVMGLDLEIEICGLKIRNGIKAVLY